MLSFYSTLKKTYLKTSFSYIDLIFLEGQKEKNQHTRYIRLNHAN